MAKAQKRVLIALGWYDYRLHRGIEKYALEHNWYLTSNLAREKVIPWGWDIRRTCSTIAGLVLRAAARSVCITSLQGAFEVSGPAAWSGTTRPPGVRSSTTSSPLRVSASGDVTRGPPCAV